MDPRGQLVDHRQAARKGDSHEHHKYGNHQHHGGDATCCYRRRRLRIPPLRSRVGLSAGIAAALPRQRIPHDGQWGPAIVSASPRRDVWTFQTITVLVHGPVLYAEILAPPINLLGPELVRDL